MRSPKDVEKKDYDEFFKSTFKEFMEPAAYSHFKTEVSEANSTSGFAQPIEVQTMFVMYHFRPGCYAATALSMSIAFVLISPESLFLAGRDEFTSPLSAIKKASYCPYNLPEETLPLLEQPLRRLASSGSRSK